MPKKAVIVVSLVEESAEKSDEEIVMDILAKASGGVSKTRIVYGVNLNFNMAERYLPLLMKRGLVVRVNSEGGDVYEITERGREVLRSYRRIREFV